MLNIENGNISINNCRLESSDLRQTTSHETNGKADLRTGSGIASFEFSLSIPELMYTLSSSLNKKSIF